MHSFETDVNLMLIHCTFCALIDINPECPNGHFITLSFDETVLRFGQGHVYFGYDHTECHGGQGRSTYIFIFVTSSQAPEQ